MCLPLDCRLSQSESALKIQRWVRFLCSLLTFIYYIVFVSIYLRVKVVGILYGSSTAMGKRLKTVNFKDYCLFMTNIYERTQHKHNAASEPRNSIYAGSYKALYLTVSSLYYVIIRFP